MSPTSATVLTGGSQQFNAIEYDQFGTAFVSQPTFTWTAGTGTVSTAGLYSPPYTSGTDTVTASDSAAGLSKSATVTLNAAVPVAPTNLTAAPDVAQIGLYWDTQTQPVAGQARTRRHLRAVARHGTCRKYPSGIPVPASRN